MLRTTTLVLSILVLPAVSHADTLTVDLGGGGQFTSLGAAIDAASSGDRIEVAPGTYIEDLDLVGKELQIVGTGGSAQTFLVSTGGSEPTVRMSNGEGPGTLLEGFDISGANTAVDNLLVGGCLHIVGAEPTLRDLVVHDCVAYVGAGMWLHESQVTLEDLEFFDNVASPLDDGNRGYGGGFYASLSALDLDGVELHDNAAERGGGAMISDCTTSASGLVAERNTAVRAGGVYVSQGSADLSGPWLGDNGATEDAGGLWVNAGAVVAIAGGTVTNNHAGTASIAGRGGAIRVRASTLSLTDVTVLDNFTDGPGTNDDPDTGGGLRVDEGGSAVLDGGLLEGNDARFGGGGYVTQSSSLVLVSTRLSDNHASYAGGGLYLSGSDSVLSLAVFDANSAEADGGGIRVQGGTATVQNSLFVDNEASNGAAVHLFSSADATLFHLSAAGNSASSGGTVRVTSDSSLSLVNSIIAYPAAGAGLSAAPGAVLDVRYNDVYSTAGPDWGGGMEDLTGQDGNLHEPPAFVDFSADGVFNDDLHLAPSSPCVDAGDPAEPADPDGTTADQGAFGGELAAGWEELLLDADGDGWSPVDGDCNDGDDSIHPGATEECNEVDDDCDGLTDEGCGDDDDSAGDDDDATSDDDDATPDDDDATSDDDDSASLIDPPAQDGCSCEGSLAGGQPAPALILLLLLGRRRRT